MEIDQTDQTIQVIPHLYGLITIALRKTITLQHRSDIQKYIALQRHDKKNVVIIAWIIDYGSVKKKKKKNNNAVAVIGSSTSNCIANVASNARRISLRAEGTHDI